MRWGTMKRQPNWLGAFIAATIFVGALGGWQFLKYSHGHGLFYYISPRFGWALLLLIAVAMRQGQNLTDVRFGSKADTGPHVC
jgi:hypothetical protein